MDRRIKSSSTFWRLRRSIDQIECWVDYRRKTCTRFVRSCWVDWVDTKVPYRSTSISSRTMRLQNSKFSFFVGYSNLNEADGLFTHRYCKRVYDNDESMRSTIFPLLLRLYLRPRPSHPLLFGPALSLLSTHAARIDPLEAFDLLPPLVSLSDMQVYLKKTLRRSTERRREVVMVKNVARSWVDQAEGELVDLEERRVKISESRVYVPSSSVVARFRQLTA